MLPWVPVGLSQFFLFEQWRAKCFVELAWLNIRFKVGRAQFFVGAALSEFPVGPSYVFV
jgi:hypothetical protein